MPTVIDSLVIQLGLDPSKFTSGQQRALQALREMAEESRRRGGEVERAGKTAAESLSRLRSEALALGAAAIGGGGIVAFAKGLADTGQQLGFTSKIIGTSVETLSLWRNAARLAGGSAEGMTSFMVRLNGELNNFQLTGNSAVIPYLRALGVNVFDAAGHLKDAATITQNLVDALDRGAEPGKVAAFLRGIGADPDTINVILQGRRALAGYLDQARALGGFTKEFADDAKEAKSAWEAFSIAVEQFGVRALTLAARGIKEFANLWRGGFSPDENLRHLGLVERGSPLDSILNAIGVTDALRASERPATFNERFGPTAAAGGGVSAGVFALVQQLRNEGFRVTSTTGGQHVGGAHREGLAVDFVPADIPGEAARLRARLAAMGVDARVIDASRPDSAAWTGPHVHVQFNSPEASARFAQQAAAGGFRGRDVTSDNRRSEVNIGTISVNAPNARDAAGIARGIGPAISGNLSDLTAQANGGQQK